MPRLHPAFFLLPLTLSGGCFIDTVYDGRQLDPPSEEDPPVTEPDGGGVDGGSAIDAGPELLHPPERPAIEDADGTDLTFGLRDIVLDPTIFEDGGWERFSFDLDQRLTVSQATSSCMGSVPIPDGARGEDNVFAATFVDALQRARGTDLQSYARTRMVDGDNIPMVRIEGWNGMDDDPRVLVWIGSSAQVENGEGGSTAEWDNRDVLYPNPSGFVEGDITQPLVLDDNAYVSGRILVALLPDASVAIPQSASVPPLALSMRDVFLVAEISVDNTRLRNARLLGRAPVVEFGRAMTESGICAGSEDQTALDILITQFVDIRANAAQDNTDPPVACDALSVGLGFTGYQVRLGAETRARTRVDPPSPCG